MPHGPFLDEKKQQLKKYFINLLLFLISSGEHRLVRPQCCSGFNMERSKADALSHSAWVSCGSLGYCQEVGSPQESSRERTRVCLPSPLLPGTVPNGPSFSTGCSEN